MKKIFVMLVLTVCCFCGIENIYAADIGYVKFNVDMSQSGYSSDAKVIVKGVSETEGVVSYSFKLSEYGDQWGYFLNAGTYRISISDKYKEEWCYEYDDSPFIITGNEEDGYTCNIKITRPEGYIEKEDENEEPHYKAIDNTEETKKENSTDKKKDEDNLSNNDKPDSILPNIVLVVGGIILLGGTIFIMFKIGNRKR